MGLIVYAIWYIISTITCGAYLVGTNVLTIPTACWFATSQLAGTLLIIESIREKLKDDDT